MINTFLDSYHAMLRIRKVELKIAEIYKEQEMRTPVHLCVGQEAPPVGISQNLLKEDLVVSGHRSHGHYLAKGGDLKSMVAEIYGKSTGCSNGKGGSQHLVDTSVGFMGSAPILGSTISIGTGLALALKKRGPGRVVISYSGDAATEEGSFHESLNFASIHSLPIIFLCENNLYSTHSKLSVRQPERPISELASGHKVASFTIDGNDVRKVRETSEVAIQRAREGQGPTLIECLTYRYLEHVGPNSDISLGYRSQEELTKWEKQDPIQIEEERLIKEISNFNIIKKQFIDSINIEINDAFSYAKNSPLPDIEELADGVYPERIIRFE